MRQFGKLVVYAAGGIRQRILPVKPGLRFVPPTRLAAVPHHLTGKSLHAGPDPLSENHASRPTPLPLGGFDLVQLPQDVFCVVLMDADLSHRPRSPETHVWVLLLVEEFVERVDRLGCQGLYTSHAHLVRGLSRLGVVSLEGVVVREPAAQRLFVDTALGRSRAYRLLAQKRQDGLLTDRRRLGTVPSRVADICGLLLVRVCRGRGVDRPAVSLRDICFVLL